jgi:hypothetical protein
MVWSVTILQQRSVVYGRHWRALVIDGRLMASEEVWEEIKRKDEACKAWVSPRRGVSVP